MKTLVALLALGMVVLFLVAEFHAIKRGGGSWKWCHRLYDKYDLQRFKW